MQLSNLFKIPFAWAAFLVLGVPSLEADLLSIQTSGLPPYTATVDGVNAYVGPVTATLSGNSVDQQIQIWCDDFMHDTVVPANFQVHVSSLPSLTDARFGSNSAALTEYEKAAWLMLQFSGLASPTSSSVADLQVAIWHVFDPGVTLTPGAGSWLTAVQAMNLSTYDFSRVAVLTPSSNCSGPTCGPLNQEYLTLLPAPVPEPATLLTIGTGLLVLGVFRRRRNRRP